LAGRPRLGRPVFDYSILENYFFRISPNEKNGWGVKKMQKLDSPFDAMLTEASGVRCRFRLSDDA
jgi:hypothetical protein